MPWSGFTPHFTFPFDSLCCHLATRPRSSHSLARIAVRSTGGVLVSQQERFQVAAGPAPGKGAQGSEPFLVPGRSTEQTLKDRLTFFASLVKAAKVLMPVTAPDEEERHQDREQYGQCHAQRPGQM